MLINDNHTLQKKITHKLPLNPIILTTNLATKQKKNKI